MEAEFDIDPILSEALQPGERITHRTRATAAVLALTERRVVVAAPSKVALAIPLEGVRRIQFDIERNRPATLVIVPERAIDEPQVLAIPPEQYQAAADALVALGLALHSMASGERPE
jgi:hypothetical protein